MEFLSGKESSGYVLVVSKKSHRQADNTFAWFFYTYIKWKEGKNMEKHIYAIVFKTYGTGETQLSFERFTSKEKARKQLKFYRACGHTDLHIVTVR